MLQNILIFYKQQVVRDGSGRLIFFIFLAEIGKIQTRVDREISAPD